MNTIRYTPPHVRIYRLEANPTSPKAPADKSAPRQPVQRDRRLAQKVPTNAQTLTRQEATALPSYIAILVLAGHYYKHSHKQDRELAHARENADAILAKMQDNPEHPLISQIMGSLVRISTTCQREVESPQTLVKQLRTAIASQDYRLMGWYIQESLRRNPAPDPKKKEKKPKPHCSRYHALEKRLGGRREIAEQLAAGVVTPSDVAEYIADNRFAMAGK